MSVADEIRKLAQLRDDGLIDEAEFDRQKKKALGDDSQGKKGGMSRVMVYFMVGVFMAGLIAYLSQTHSAVAPEITNARAAIKLCWQDYERKSNSETTKQFIAGTCEKMEDDFKSKYGLIP